MPDSPQEPKTEREKYIEGLEAKLRKAGKAKRFSGSEDGTIVTDFLTEQINSLVKNLGGTKYLDDPNRANYDRGQLAMAQKILTTINAEATTDTADLQEKLKAAKTDE